MAEEVWKEKSTSYTINKDFTKAFAKRLRENVSEGYSGYCIGLPKDVLLKAMKLMSYNAQFKLIDETDKGHVRRHFLVDTKTSDYKYIKDIACEKAQQEMKVDIMPTLVENDPLRDVIFHDAIKNRNPDLRINGIPWEVEQPTKPLKQNNLGHSIGAGSKQANHVIINTQLS